MTESPGAGFPPDATYGYLAESGVWRIDLPPAPVSTPADLERRTQTLLDVFFHAFHGLARPAAIYADVVQLDANGEIARVHEGEQRPVATRDTAGAARALATLLDTRGPGYISVLFLTCDLRLLLPGPAGGWELRWVPAGGEFYLGYLPKPPASALLPDEGSVQFTTGLDIWVPRTLDPRTWTLRNNHAAAAQNGSRLAAALRAWEAATGEPLAEWTSQYYGDAVVRYGFRDPDAAGSFRPTGTM